MASGESVQAPDHRIIDIFDLVPIYAEEHALVLDHGWKDLIKRFSEQGVPQYVDVGRPNTATRSE